MEIVGMQDHPSDPVIDTQGLTKRFDKFTAVDRVTFQVQKREVVGYLGPNGCGKTTTIRMLLGLLRPTSGSAHVLGFDCARQTEEIRRRVGYMSQKFALYDELTVEENVVFYAGVYGIGSRQRIQAVIEQVGLGQHRKLLARALSTGWRQRVALATAIVHQPALLFLDEPTSGVDPTTRRSFWELIYNLVDEGVTAFVTTHYMDEAEYCSKIGIMRDGCLLAMDTPSALKRSAIKGLLWEIEAQPLLEVLEALNTQPQVLRTRLAGDHLSAITAPGVSEELLRSIIVTSGGKCLSLKQVEPNLEDIFLALALGK